MRDEQLYEHLLDIRAPWRVERIEINDPALEIRVHLSVDPAARLICPTRGRTCPGYDRRTNAWRHLDTCEYKTILVAAVPRVECPEHGVLTTHVPWSEGRSKYTMRFQSLVVDWLSETTVSAVARRMGLDWRAVDVIMRRAVERGMKRRQDSPPASLSVDETSFRKRHQYVTVVTDRQSGAVVHVSEDRRTSSLDAYYQSRTAGELSAIVSVSMDMWPAYIASTRQYLPQASTSISFDRFHVQQMILGAVDKVRRLEHRAMRHGGSSPLTGSKYLWLRNTTAMGHAEKRKFALVRAYAHTTSRAWRLKQAASELWSYSSTWWATAAWKKWIAWARRSQLEPMKRVAATIAEHLWGIVNAIVNKVSNAHAESANSRIQLVKSRARGFRSVERFRTAIYFYCGKLDMKPRP